MNQLQSIFLYPAKRVKPCPAEEAKIVAGGGLEGDFRCHDERKQVSLTDQVVLDWMKAQEEPGLCFAKFSANLVMDALDYDQIAPGDQITLGDASLEVQSKGKHCFGDECVYCRKGIDCILTKGILFACGKREGSIHKGIKAEVIK